MVNLGKEELFQRILQFKSLTQFDLD